MVVVAYVEELTRALSPATVKQHLAALRMLFDWLVVGQVLPLNPAGSVRGPRHIVKAGKTPVLSAKETRATWRILRPSSRGPSDRPRRKPARPGLVPATRTSRARSRLRGGYRPPGWGCDLAARAILVRRILDVPLDSGVFPGLAALALPRARLPFSARPQPAPGPPRPLSRSFAQLEAWI